MPWSNQGGGPWGSGGSKGPWGQGPQSSGPTPPDLEELLRRSQDKLKSVLPGGNLGGRGVLLIVVAALLVWGFSGFFKVEPDELGAVLRFGKYTRDAQPGLNYHLPYPIETVLTPKVTRVNRIDIGMRLIEDPRRTSQQIRDIPEESLMLTGDENIVDIDVSVFWQVKVGGAKDYLFNIQNPEGTVKAVAESAMREVVGRSDIQPILTGARQSIETSVHELMQKVLDTYQAGVQVHAGADAEGRSARRR
jgi:membrane protease subunit HflK